MEISECLSATEYCGMEIIARSLPQLESRPKEVLMQHCCCCCSRCCYCCCTKFDLMFWMLCLIFLRDKVESCLQCDAKLWGATEESYLLTLKNWQSTLCPVAEECCRSNVIGCDWVALQCQQLGASLAVQNRTVQIVKIHLAGGIGKIHSSCILLTDGPQPTSWRWSKRIHRQIQINASNPNLSGLGGLSLGQLILTLLHILLQTFSHLILSISHLTYTVRIW